MNNQTIDPPIKVLAFDVFGTVVDWHSSIAREAGQIAAAHGIQGDWGKFAQAWRAGYAPAMDRVRKGELPWLNIDALHRLILDSIVDGFGLGGLSEGEREHLNRAWHRLDPWPDSVSGLARLRTKYVCSTLSNGNLSLLVNMARHAGLQWDCVLSADLTGAFKPQPECYQAGARFLDLEPSQVLMVAAHKADLLSAQKAGLQAAFVPRPMEAGPNRKVDLTPDPAFQYVAKDFHDLADQLGCAPA